MKYRILRFLIPLFMLCMGTAEGAFGGFALAGQLQGERAARQKQERAQDERERAILYGRLKAEGFTRGFLNDASLYDLIRLVAFIDQLRVMRTSPEDIKSHLSEIEKEHFKQKAEAAALKRLKAKDRKRQ